MLNVERCRALCTLIRIGLSIIVQCLSRDVRMIPPESSMHDTCGEEHICICDWAGCGRRGAIFVVIAYCSKAVLFPVCTLGKTKTVMFSILQSKSKT